LETPAEPGTTLGGRAGRLRVRRPADPRWDDDPRSARPRETVRPTADSGTDPDRDPCAAGRRQAGLCLPAIRGDRLLRPAPRDDLYPHEASSHPDVLRGRQPGPPVGSSRRSRRCQPVVRGRTAARALSDVSGPSDIGGDRGVSEGPRRVVHLRQRDASEHPGADGDRDRLGWIDAGSSASMTASMTAWRLAGASLLVVAILVRALLLPTPGLSGDLDQFVLWVHGLATSPFGNAYDQNLSLPPVMADIWGLLAAIEPAFRTATTAADPAIRAIMKTPASLADLALGLLVVWHLRATPRWALLGGAAILLHPAVVDVSAWWGQYESIYVLGGAVAYVLAVRGHSLWAAAALGVALMTKPQALPFLVPFGAWVLARDGWRGALQAALVGAVVIALL